MIQMSKREKIYAAGGGLFLIVVVGWLALIRPYYNGIDKAQKSIESGRQDLRTMIDLYKGYAELQSQVQELENKIQKDQDFSILSSLEQLASDAGVSDLIDKMEERKPPENNFYKEESVEVSLKRVPLKELIDYMYKIESSANLLLVRKMSLSTRYDQRDMTDAKIEVSSFKPL